MEPDEIVVDHPADMAETLNKYNSFLFLYLFATVAYLL